MGRTGVPGGPVLALAGAWAHRLIGPAVLSLCPVCVLSEPVIMHEKLRLEEGHDVVLNCHRDIQREKDSFGILCCITACLVRIFSLLIFR